MVLYHMSIDQHVQNRARKEILEVLEKHNNEITFEALNEMKYLSQVVEGEYSMSVHPKYELLLIFKNDV